MEVIQISQELEEKIRQAETVEEVVQACTEEGIQITKEQLEAGLLPESEGELSEDMLDNVSGGSIVRLAYKIVSIFRGGRSNGNGSGGRFSAGGGFGGGGGGGGFR